MIAGVLISMYIFLWNVVVFRNLLLYSQFQLPVRYPCKILRRLFGLSAWNLEEAFKMGICTFHSYI